MSKGEGKGEGKAALYDLTTDLSETTNVAAQHPEVVEKLTAELEKIVSSSPKRTRRGIDSFT